MEIKFSVNNLFIYFFIWVGASKFELDHKIKTNRTICALFAY